MIFKYSGEQTDYLKRREPLLKEVIERIGPIEREMEPDLYAGVIRQIVAQQISTRAYMTIWDKIVALVDDVKPDSFIALEADALQACGLSWRKVDHILEFTRAVASREIDLDHLVTLDNREFVKELVKIKGIGPWSAQMVLIFTLGRQDVISFDDLGIMRGLKRLYQVESFTDRELERFGDLVHPYGSVASLYLWELAHEKTAKPTPVKHDRSDHAVYPSPVGPLKISYQGEVITGICWTGESGSGTRTALSDLVFRQLEEYFAGQRTGFDFPYRLEGTTFQLQVWHELEKIPYGSTCTYKDIAIAIGNERAVRAVGGANNKNPLAIVVPCHRVIGANKKLVGYAAGLDIKHKLLDLEANNQKRGS